jgi:hypothetical protein
MLPTVQYHTMGGPSSANLTKERTFDKHCKEALRTTGA